MGWDTIDELLALYYGWEFKTDDSLHVKHLKPTGANYNKGAKHLQGTALYKMRYGITLAFLSALKLAYKKQRISLFWDYMTGYIKASRQTEPFLITEDQGIFVRTYRWKKYQTEIQASTLTIQFNSSGRVPIRTPLMVSKTNCPTGLVSDT